jgi:N-acetylated-alpha-linked acidic dipeptidase
MGRSRLMVFFCVLGLLLPAGSRQGARALAGDSVGAAPSAPDWEQKFRAIPAPRNMREYMRRLSARPHHVGSAYDKENAEWILAKLKEWGWDAHIESFDVLFPTPRERAVELVEPTRFVAKLEEPAVPEDPTSNQQAEQLPTYNAYSIDGDVTAPLVYVNYGIPEDYEQLERLGVSVKGAIVMARYGKSWRGIKPKVAAEHGALGCLIYSDPRDDGYYDGDVFPRGPWRPRDGVQRGSVMDMVLYPGDPLTPGVGATPQAKRLDLKDVPTLTKIPVLPISYGDAQPLLEALDGTVAPEAWRGALAITYHVGPGPARVHLKVKSNWDRKPLYDVIARIPGSVFPDEWVVRGNHHDAWVNGAQDPISGLVAELEEARALGELLKAGWKPKRTIIYCAWDGEEPGLLGSTEWAEQHAEELRQHGVAYINSDSNSRGYLNVSGSHTLEKMINGVVRDVQDPEKQVSVWKRVQLRRIELAKRAEERQQLREQAAWRIEALGSGSDYSVFLDHLGIASLNLAYGGEAGSGIYHSIYDDFFWYTHFDDPDLVYGRALAQTAGTAVMRLADADLLPFDFATLADVVRSYVTELEKLSNDVRDEIRERNREIDEGVFAVTSDPKKPFVPPAKENVPPRLDFTPLWNALDTLSSSAERCQALYAKAKEGGGATLAQASLAAVNRRLVQSERALTSAEGLPGRPWFKHQLYAPGFYTGYGVKTVPAVREAIERKQWKQADEAIVHVAKVLQNEATVIDAARSELEKALGQSGAAH